MVGLGRRYPKELETYATIRDGTRIFFRPIKPSDEPLMRNLFYSFSEESIYYRFFGVLKDMTHEQLQHYVNVDYEEKIAIVGVLKENGAERLVAVGRYALTPASDVAEFAVIVQDSWQNRGIGTFLLEYLVQIAKKRGIKGFTAEVMADNTRMLHVFEKSGYAMEKKRLDNTYQVTLRFR